MRKSSAEKFQEAMEFSSFRSFFWDAVLTRMKGSLLPDEAVNEIVKLVWEYTREK